MKKTYIIDTNVLIQAPYALECFEDNNLVLGLKKLPDTNFVNNRLNGIKIVVDAGHGGDDFGCQSGENAGLDAAAQTVRQDNHRGIRIMLDDLHMVAAELFTKVVDAQKTDVGAILIHR